MKKKLINIFTNGSQFSLETQADLTKKLVDRGYTVTREYSQDAELIICIGGDGSLLETVHSCNFPECPIMKAYPAIKFLNLSLSLPGILLSIEHFR